MLEDTFDSCWKCGTSDSGVSPGPSSTAPPANVTSPRPKGRRQSQPAGGMDFQKLSGFILFFGLILLCIGGVNFLSNLPVSAPQTTEPLANTTAGMMARANQMGNEMATQAENENRSIKRQGALKVIGAGGVIIFAAFAIMQSIRKPTSTDDAS